jgi:hypothetical protein
MGIFTIIGVIVVILFVAGLFRHQLPPLDDRPGGGIA